MIKVRRLRRNQILGRKERLGRNTQNAFAFWMVSPRFCRRCPKIRNLRSDLMNVCECRWTLISIGIVLGVGNKANALLESAKAASEVTCQNFVIGPWGWWIFCCCRTPVGLVLESGGWFFQDMYPDCPDELWTSIFYKKSHCMDSAEGGSWCQCYPQKGTAGLETCRGRAQVASTTCRFMMFC